MDDIAFDENNNDKLFKEDNDNKNQSTITVSQLSEADIALKELPEALQLKLINKDFPRIFEVDPVKINERIKVMYIQLLKHATYIPEDLPPIVQVPIKEESKSDENVENGEGDDNNKMDEEVEKEDAEEVEKEDAEDEDFKIVNKAKKSDENKDEIKSYMKKYYNPSNIKIPDVFSIAQLKKKSKDELEHIIKLETKYIKLKEHSILPHYKYIGLCLEV